MLSAFDQLRVALASAYPLTVLVSLEEERMEKLLRRFGGAARPEPLPLYVWNCVDGFANDGGGSLQDAREALAWVGSEAPRGFYLFKDLGEQLEDRQLLRRLRDTAMKVRNTGRFVFLLKQSTQLPEPLKPLSYVVLSLFPDLGEVQAVVTSQLQGRSVSAEVQERLVAALRGMSLTEAEHLLRRLLDRHKELGKEFFSEVLAEKEQVTRKEGILEFVAPDDTLAELGGLDQLKSWLADRAELFTPEARRRALPIPRGMLLMGISGCGKSLAVKAVARLWNLPLFRLDMNLVFAGTQGSAEWVFHRALEAVAAVAPAVLWIDEIEMGVAGYHEGETGSLTRIFSTFLTWMQEHKEEVFVAATANRIKLLPAEILRKGRFDQVFFVDLPNEEERKEILAIHLRRHQLDPVQYDLILLASATRGWNGAEIEAAVAQARVAANAAGRSVSPNDMLAAFGKIVPLSRTMEEQLKEIRSWARTRALPATSSTKQEM